MNENSKFFIPSQIFDIVSLLNFSYPNGNIWFCIMIKTSLNKLTFLYLKKFISEIYLFIWERKRMGEGQKARKRERS